MEWSHSTSATGDRDCQRSKLTACSNGRTPGPDRAPPRTLAGPLDAHQSTVDGVLQRIPDKLNRIFGTATYGSWFHFYLCGFDGRIVLPTGAVMSPKFVNSAARCQRGAGE